MSLSKSKNTKTDSEKNVSSKPNPSLPIVIFDAPRIILGGLPVPSKLDYEWEKHEGTIVAEGIDIIEVDNKLLKDQKLASFLLRKGKNALPSFVHGGLSTEFAWTAFIPFHFSLPAAGSKIVLNPKIPSELAALLDSYVAKRADVTWIIHVPAPIGTAVFLRAYGPEFDNSTETRGVRWKTSEVNTIAFTLQWSSDCALHVKQRPGQSGLSLVILCDEDNTTQNVVIPLTATALCHVHNVKCTGTKSSNPVDYPLFNFKPVTT